MILAGLHIDKNGVRVEDKIIDVLKFTLTEYKVKTMNDAMHVVGVLQYANSAFEFDTGSWNTFTELLSILIDTYAGLQTEPKGRPARSEFQKRWNQPAVQNAMELLFDCITNRPRAYMDPASLVSPKTCMIAQTDASDRGEAVSCNLHLVYKADARTVTKQDLEDRKISQLISVKFKRLNGTQNRWSTYEKEMYGLVRIVENYGGIITAATVKYPPGADVCKIGLWNDATTALAQFASLTIPTGQIDHLSAKARRFYSWADKCASTVYWNMELRHFPSECISLPHMMTHMGDAAGLGTRI